MVLKRMKQLRKEHGLTQTQIAKSLGITQRSYSRYETGERGLPTEILIAIADYYQVSADYILERTDQK